MMKKSSTILLLLILLIPTFSCGQNLILNPGFENGITGWLQYSPAAAATQFDVDKTEFHAGNASGKIISNLSSTEAACYFQIPTITERESYECSYWVKTDSIEKYLFSLVQFKDSNNNDITQITHPISGIQANWYNIKFRFKAPEKTIKVFLSIFLMGKGVLWLDDVSLIRLSDATYQNFSVNLQRNPGVFKKLLGTNTGPVNPFGFQDYTPKFQEIGIDYVRTHDYQIAFDFHVIFPDISKNPFDPSAYNFSKTDSCVADIINAKSKILFRLGESAGSNIAYSTPPADMDKWAQVALQIIKHYNNNWNNGYAYNIKYWEIWNEPDLHQFWNGTIEQYIALYRLTASKIKSFDSSLHVGGPAFACAYDTKWMNTFLDSVRRNTIPLDFLSYHLYDLFNPYGLRTMTNYVKQKLLSANLPNTELILDEWNPYSYNQLPSNYGKDDALNSASTVSGMKYLQDSPIDKLFRYSTDALDFPLFKWDNTYTYQGYAYKAVGELAKMEHTLATTGGDLLGTTISAGRSVSGSQSVVLIADNSSSSNGYNLDMSGITNGETWSYQITRLDSRNKYITVKSGMVTNSSHLITEKVQSPFVDQILFTINAVNGIMNQYENPDTLFPNPSTNQITINVSDIGQTTIILYDIFSHQVLRHTFTKSTTINTEQLAAGVYFYELRNAIGTMRNGKVIKR